MDQEEMKDVDALGKERAVTKPYRVVEDVRVPEVTDVIKAADVNGDADRVKPLIDQDAAEANLSAPGVEATAAVEDEREAKASATKKRK